MNLKEYISQQESNEIICETTRDERQCQCGIQTMVLRKDTVIILVTNVLYVGLCLNNSLNYSEELFSELFTEIGELFIE